MPADEATIQDGIDAALDGDIVEVAAGTYFETLVIFDKTITLRSEDGASATIIDGSDSGTVVLVLNAPDTVIEGFSIVDGEQLSGAGVWIESSDGTLVDDCVINGNDAVGAGDGGHQMLDRSDRDAVLVAEDRAQLGIDHPVPQSRNIDSVARQVSAAENDARVRIGGAQGHGDLLAGMQAHACAGNDLLEGPLVETARTSRCVPVIRHAVLEG